MTCVCVCVRQDATLRSRWSFQPQWRPALSRRSSSSNWSTTWAPSRPCPPCHARTLRYTTRAAPSASGDSSREREIVVKWNVKWWRRVTFTRHECWSLWFVSTRGRTWAAWTESLSLLKRPRLCSQVTHINYTLCTMWIWDSLNKPVCVCVCAQEWVVLLRLRFLRVRWTLCCPSSPARERDSELATRNWRL